MVLSTWALAALLAGQEVVHAKGAEVFRPEAAWIVEYRTGDATCAGRPLKRVDGDPVAPALNWFEGEIPARPEAPALLTTFRVDAEGRPRSIRVDWTNRADDVVPARVDHVEAVLVGWRFEAGEPRSACVLPIATPATPIAQAPRKLRMGVLGVNDWQFQTVQEASPQKDLGTGCRDLQARTVVHPEVGPIQPPPGRRRWTVLSFDVNAEGTPIDVKVEETSGPERFTEAARRSVEDSRFQPGGAFKGCVAAIALNGGTVPKPVIDLDAMPRSNRRSAPGQPGCGPAVQPRFRHKGTPEYPREMIERNIEGKAYVRLDVTPQGGVRPRVVVASEPSSAFGDAAMDYLEGISAEPSPNGFSDCLMPITFSVPD